MLKNESRFKLKISTATYNHYILIVKLHSFIMNDRIYNTVRIYTILSAVYTTTHHKLTYTEFIVKETQ